VIDWLWMRVPLASAVKVKTGRVIAFDPNGEQEWMTEKWLETRGSYDGKMAVRRAEFQASQIEPEPTCRRSSCKAITSSAPMTSKP
jgi:hypothetical protein